MHLVLNFVLFMGVQSHPNTRGDFERLLKMHVCSKLAWTGFSF